MPKTVLNPPPKKKINARQVSQGQIMWEGNKLFLLKKELMKLPFIIEV